MDKENQTRVDKAWSQIKNQKYLAAVIVAGAVIMAISSFSDSLAKLVKTVYGAMPDKQAITVFKASEPVSGKIFTDYFNSSFAVADTEENDIVEVTKGQVSIDFSINGDSTDKNLSYVLQERHGHYTINPANRYLSLLKNGGPIGTDEYEHIDFRFPTLDFKVTNNSAETVYFTKAVFKVSTSKPDPFPVLGISRGYNMSFPVENIGWGKVYHCRIFFNLEPTDVPVDFNKPYKYELPVGDFDKEARVDLSDIFNQSGAQAEILRKNLDYGRRGFEFINADGIKETTDETEYKKRMAEAKGPFQDGQAKIFGEIVYEGMNAAGEMLRSKVKFEGSVSLGPPLMGAAMPPSFVYQVKLDENRDNYQKVLPLSQSIPARGTDRFNIKIAAPKSSRHQFSLTLFYNDGNQFEVPDLLLNYFMTRNTHIQ